MFIYHHPLRDEWTGEEGVAYWGRRSDLWRMECVLFVCYRSVEQVCLRHILSASKCSPECEFA